MSDLMKREFEVLTAHGSNYLSWALDAEILLSGKGLLKTVLPKAGDPAATDVENAQALHFLRHHLSATLKNEYMTERNPKVLWDSLRGRFEHIETVLLPKVEREWQNLRFQDYKTVEEYNTALYGIVTRMKLCGKELEQRDLINKTLSTFHPKFSHVSRQYKKENYTTYVALSNALQQDQGEDDLIMENHKSRPTGSLAPHEANATSFKKKWNKGRKGQKAPQKTPPKAQNNPNTFKKNNKGKSKKTPSGGEYGKQDQTCYKCGMHGHWSKICRTPKHLVDMYQSLKKKLAEHEVNYVEGKKPTTEAHTEPSKNDDDLELDDDLIDEDDVHGDSQ